MKLAMVLLTLIVYGAARINAYSLTEGLKSMENEKALTRGLAQTEMNDEAAIKAQMRVFKRAFDQAMEHTTEDDQDMKIAKRNLYVDILDKLVNPQLLKCAIEVLLDMTCTLASPPAKPPAQSPAIKAQMRAFKRAFEQALEDKTEDDQDIKILKRNIFGDILDKLGSPPLLKWAIEVLLDMTCTPKPFYQTEQLIFTPDSKTYLGEDYLPIDEFQEVYMGPALNHKDLLHRILEIQNNIANKIEAKMEDGTYVTLSDICLKPLSPDNNNCAILSPLQYFQNNHSNIDFEPNPDDWEKPCWMGGFREQLIACVRWPTLRSTNCPGFACLGDFGGPVMPKDVLGDYNKFEVAIDYLKAKKFIIKFPIKVEAEDKAKAKAWEKRYLDYVHEITADLAAENITVTATSIDDN